MNVYGSRVTGQYIIQFNISTNVDNKAYVNYDEEI